MSKLLQAATALPKPTRPSLSLLGSEPWRAVRELISLRSWRRQFQGTGTGDGHPVILFPGLASDGRALGPLREHCRSLGHPAVDWQRGFNTGPRGDLDPWLHELAADVMGRLPAGAPPPTLIGWSLGGIYAREIAKLPGVKVRQVITIGTPFDGTPDLTHVGWLYRLLNGAPAVIDSALLRRLRTPPPVKTTSIYSRDDGIVAWQACRHARCSSRVRDIEVAGSHLGMGWNPAVLRVVGDLLATPQARTQRTRRPAQPKRTSTFQRPPRMMAASTA